MNTHKHARLTFARRREMVRQMTEQSLSVSAAAALHGVTPPTVRKWLGRYLAEGEAGLMDASSRPKCSPRAIAPAKALLIVELRQRRMLQAQIARSVGVSGATVSRVLARAGISKLSDLQPREPVQRYEHAAPGDLLHIDTKKLGRIERPSHRVTGNRRDSVEGAGWETLFVAIDDHARIAFTQMHPDETKPRAVAFLRAAVAYYAGLLLSLPISALLALGSESHPLTLLDGIRINLSPFVGNFYFSNLADWGEIHKLLGDVTIWLASIHALAAIYHHTRLKDKVLVSMLP